VKSGIGLGERGATFLRMLQVVSLLAVLAPIRGSSAIGGEGHVHGRVEILNPKVRLRGGQADAGGVVVWLIPTMGEPERPVQPPRRKLEQRDKRFVPHVMAVEVGTEIDFPNHDPFFHNVFSVYDGKVFDLGLYANGESRPVRFDRPGVSYIFCNIHPQMSAVIVAVETPWFTVSGPDGGYAIKDVPPGEYRLRFWHERSDPRQTAALTRVVAIEASGADLGSVRLDETDYIAKPHLDKHGEEYESQRDLPTYRRP